MKSRAARGSCSSNGRFSLKKAPATMAAYTAVATDACIPMPTDEIPANSASEERKFLIVSGHPGLFVDLSINSKPLRRQ
jgi:hypothetical protein